MMEVGTVVKLLTPMLGEELHSVGVVFYTYDELGAEVIFMDGGYDGFSASEQKDFLQVIGKDEKISDYKFKNVIQVEQDYSNGMWDHVFQDKRYRKDRGY